MGLAITPTSHQWEWCLGFEDYGLKESIAPDLNHQLEFKAPHYTSHNRLYALQRGLYPFMQKAVTLSLFATHVRHFRFWQQFYASRGCSVRERFVSTIDIRGHTEQRISSQNLPLYYLPGSLLQSMPLIYFLKLRPSYQRQGFKAGMPRRMSWE